MKALVIYVATSVSIIGLCLIASELTDWYLDRKDRS